MSAYLTFTPADGAKLLLSYSDKPVPDALLVAHLKKSVPQFKKAKSEEIVKNLQKQKTLYYQGIAQFVKATRAYDGVIELGGSPGPLPFRVSFLTSANEVVHLTAGAKLATTDYVVCAAVPLDNRDFEARTLDRGLFTSKANAVGGFVDLK